MLYSFFDMHTSYIDVVFSFFEVGKGVFHTKKTNAQNE